MNNEEKHSSAEVLREQTPVRIDLNHGRVEITDISRGGDEE